MKHQCASAKQRLPRAGRGGGFNAAARPRPSSSSVVIVSSKAAAQSTTIATSVADDPYADLAACAGVVVESKNGGGPRAVAGVTALGRGLVLDGDAPAQRGATLVSVPIANALVIADEPMGGISAFSDRQHAAWQAAHGDMPSALLDFITGEERWDARMAAWLLYVRRHHQGALWRRYAALLPAERDAACLLAFREADEAAALQLPELIEEATVQTRWCARGAIFVIVFLGACMCVFMCHVVLHAASLTPHPAHANQSTNHPRQGRLPPSHVFRDGHVCLVRAQRRKQQQQRRQGGARDGQAGILAAERHFGRVAVGDRDGAVSDVFGRNQR